MRKLICWLLLSMLCCLPVCHAAEVPVLPDPGLSVQAVGRQLREDTDPNGVPCTVYGYTFSRGDLSFSFVLMAYEWKVEGQGFTWKKLSTKYADDNLSVSDWYSINKSGHTAHIHLTGNLLGRTCTLTLYVPRGLYFSLENSQDSGASFYNDGFPDSAASGEAPSFYNSWGTGSSTGSTSDFYNEVIETLDDPQGSTYSDAPTTCGYCHGSGRCPECYGSGRFRNPYTGTYLECSCNHGECALCDGEGVW